MTIKVLKITPCNQVEASVRLPGSKYIANRLIPMCALATSPSQLTNIVDNNDIQAAIAGLNALGYQLQFSKNQLDLSPRQNKLSSAVTLNTSHSGTFSRFVAAVAALDSVDVKIECSEKMATRPMQELFDSLRELGVSIKTDANNEMLPATITGPVINQKCECDAGRSSQFLSALLIIGPLLEKGIEINLIGSQVSSSYVDMTIFWMEKMGINIERFTNSETGLDSFKIEPGQSYSGINVEVPGDAVSASYFMGLAGIAGGRITIQSFDYNSLQGESKFYQVLELMGMTFKKTDTDITAISNGQLKAIEIDMSEMPDVVQTLAVMACYAKGTTVIKNIAHLAYKESNRIIDTANEIAKTGINVKYGEDYLKIEGGVPQAAIIETYEDHRMAMSMALLGAKTEGIVIKDQEVVNKSFPNYWTLMRQCGLGSQSNPVEN